MGGWPARHSVVASARFNALVALCPSCKPWPARTATCQLGLSPAACDEEEDEEEATRRAAHRTAPRRTTWPASTGAAADTATTMASYLRSKQAGIQSDLSGSISSELFTPDDQARYGINSQIRCSSPAARHVDVGSLT